MIISFKKTFPILIALCLLLSLSCMVPSALAAEAEQAPPADKEIPKILTQLTAGPVVLSGTDRCIATTSTEGLAFSYGWYDTAGQPVTGNFEVAYYDLVMRFTAADGYVIKPDVAAYLNNSPRDLTVSVAADGKSATIAKRFEAAIWRPIVFKSPGDEVKEEGSWVSYAVSGAYYTDLTWELTSPDGNTTIDAERAIQQFPGVNVDNNHFDRINFYNLQTSMNGWNLVAVFHGVEDLQTRSNATVLQVTPDPNKTPATPEPTPTPEATPEATPAPENPAAPETAPAVPGEEPAIEPTSEHEHSFAEAWSFDDQKHWHDCTGCEERAEEAEHSFVWTETKKATSAEPGEEEGVCEVCGFTTVREKEFEGQENFLRRVPIQFPIYAILGLIVVLIAAESIRSAVRKKK